MKRSVLEGRVLDIIDRVKAKQPLEDDGLELKRVWLDHKKAARRLAGHANASRGEPILWLIGVDEDSQVIPGADPNELADWYSQVQSQFEGRTCPELLVFVHVPVDGVVVTAMYFLTDQAPYVVKNPAGGSITGDVPWRMGTRTDSATRQQLLRILTPAQKVPTLEFLEGWLSVSTFQEVKGNRMLMLVLKGQFQFYLYHNVPSRLTIPRHRMEYSLEVPGVAPKTCCRVTMIKGSGSQITANIEEIVASGPGCVEVAMTGFTPFHDSPHSPTANLFASLHAVDAEQPGKVAGVLSAVNPRRDEEGRWEFREPAKLFG